MTLTVVTVDESQRNREYVRRLLKRKQPLFAAALELALARAERELPESAEGCGSLFLHRQELLACCRMGSLAPVGQPEAGQ
jgi:hypothetical protein